MPSLQGDQTDQQFSDWANYHFHNSFKVYCTLVLPNKLPFVDFFNLDRKLTCPARSSYITLLPHTSA